MRGVWTVVALATAVLATVAGGAWWVLRDAGVEPPDVAVESPEPGVRAGTPRGAAAPSDGATGAAADAPATPHAPAKARPRPPRARAAAQKEAADEAAAGIEDLRRKAEALRKLIEEQQTAAALAAPGVPVPTVPPDGPYLERFSDGRVKVQGSFRGGKRDGVWTEFTKDGARSETEYVEGVQHGREAEWTAAGVPRFIGSYDRGVMSGTWTSWHATGVVRDTREYVGGKVHGMVRTFRDDGSVEAESTYAQGQDVAPTYGWYADGAPQFVMPYVDGKRQGEAIWYFASGAVKARGTYVDGDLHGRFVNYAEDGREASVETWDRGRQVAGKVSRDPLAGTGVIGEQGENERR